MKNINAGLFEKNESKKDDLTNFDPTKASAQEVFESIVNFLFFRKSFGDKIDNININLLPRTFIMMSAFLILFKSYIYSNQLLTCTPPPEWSEIPISVFNTICLLERTALFYFTGDSKISEKALSPNHIHDSPLESMYKREYKYVKHLPLFSAMPAVFAMITMVLGNCIFHRYVKKFGNQIGAIYDIIESSSRMKPELKSINMFRNDKNVSDSNKKSSGNDIDDYNGNYPIYEYLSHNLNNILAKNFNEIITMILLRKSILLVLDISLMVMIFDGSIPNYRLEGTQERARTFIFPNEVWCRVNLRLTHHNYSQSDNSHIKLIKCSIPLASHFDIVGMFMVLILSLVMIGQVVCIIDILSYWIMEYYRLKRKGKPIDYHMLLDMLWPHDINFLMKNPKRTSKNATVI